MRDSEGLCLWHTWTVVILRVSLSRMPWISTIPVVLLHMKHFLLGRCVAIEGLWQHWWLFNSGDSGDSGDCQSSCAFPLYTWIELQHGARMYCTSPINRTFPSISTAISEAEPWILQVSPCRISMGSSQLMWHMRISHCRFEAIHCRQIIFLRLISAIRSHVCAKCERFLFCSCATRRGRIETFICWCTIHIGSWVSFW